MNADRNHRVPKNASLAAQLLAPMKRRAAIKHAIGTALAATATASCETDLETLFAEWGQQHYTRLSSADKQRIFARLEGECKQRYGVDVEIDDPSPLPGTEVGYALNLSKCVGCRRCVYACVRENNPSRAPQIHFIRVLEMDKGSLDVEKADSYYDRATVPAAGKYYMPVQCHQCKNPPCVKVCPVEATWQEPDGITVVDYNWCIGCRYCEAACPYWARRFNFTEPSIPPHEINPRQAYLGNRLRRRGVMEKCTFCLHRVRKGLYPACVEACPTGSRKFGNLRDPNSEVRRIIESKRVYVFREDVGTDPRFFYFFD